MRLILLTLHIGGGIFGILAGAVAMCFRKGSRWHALAGKVFVGAMLTMSACGATLAVMRQETPNILAGTLTFYLVATAWMTARRGDRKTGIFDWVALAFAAVVGVAEIAMGVRVVMNPAAGSAGVPVFMYFLFAAIVLLAAGGDARMITRGGIFGKKRIVRHLWRITFSFFIATGSFFLGQQRVFPAEWRGATIWLVLGLFPLVLLIGWMIRMWFTKYGRQLVVAEQP